MAAASCCAQRGRPGRRPGRGAAALASVQRRRDPGAQLGALEQVAGELLALGPQLGRRLQLVDEAAGSARRAGGAGRGRGRWPCRRARLAAPSSSRSKMRSSTAPGQPPRRLVAEAVLQLVAVLVEVAVEALAAPASTTSSWRPSLVRAPSARPAIGTIDADSRRSRTSRSSTSWTASSSRRSTTSTAPPSTWPASRSALAGSASQRGHPVADVGGPHPLGDGVGGEEAGLDELAERLAELLLALGDDRGVGDRQPERVAEQRHHGEPVGQPADHRGLGGGLHVARARCRPRRRRPRWRRTRR